MTLGFAHLTIEKYRFTWEDGYLKAGKEDGAKTLQQLCGHDFGEFLSGLKQLGPGGVRGPVRQLEEANVRAGISTTKEVSNEAARTTAASGSSGNNGQ